MSSFPGTQTTLQKFQEFLRKRKISEVEADELGLLPFTAAQIGSIVGWSLREDGAGITFYDVDGSPLLNDTKTDQFIRFRRFGVEGSGKYIQPKHTGIKAYLPKLRGRVNWVEVATDKSVDVVLTEGEFKAISLVQQGVPCIGLTGVDSWKDKRTRQWCAPMDQFDWNGRHVMICFDADDKSTRDHPYKREVRAAAQRLADELMMYGAEVSLLYLSRVPGFRVGEKMGLDDFIHAGGKWEDLLQTADRLEDEGVLGRLRKEYAVMTGILGGNVIRLRDGLTWPTSTFVNSVEGNTERQVGTKRELMSQKYIRHENRTECTDIIFNPGREPGYSWETEEYNSWKGFAFDGSEVGDVVGGQDWEALVRGMCGDHWEYVMSWFAHLMQRPGDRCNVALVCKSKTQGIGKTLMGEIVQKLVGYEHSVSLPFHMLTSKFNKHVGEKVLIQVDEANALYAGAEGILKNIITNPRITIEPKGLNAYSVDNYARLFFSSNAASPFRVEEGERRYFIWEPPWNLSNRAEWDQWLLGMLSRMNRGGAEGRAWLEGVARYLLEWDWEGRGFMPTAAAPETEWLRDMVQDSARVVDVRAELFMDRMAAELGGVAVIPKEADSAFVREARHLLKSRGGLSCTWTLTKGVGTRAVWFLDRELGEAVTTARMRKGVKDGLQLSKSAWDEKVRVDLVKLETNTALAIGAVLDIVRSTKY